jgi:hypothetical protein
MRFKEEYHCHGTGHYGAVCAHHLSGKADLGAML